MKEQIMQLRAEGCSYNEIVRRLGCAKSTIAFHCSTKESHDKHLARSRKHKAKARALKQVIVRPPRVVKIKKEIKEKPRGLRVDKRLASDLEPKKLFKTIPLNLDQKIPVRINAKTIVYAKNEADVERIKLKYSQS